MKVELLGPVVDDRDLSIRVSELAQFKLDEYVAQCSTEISGLGLVTHRLNEETGAQSFRIEDVMLAPQRCSSAATDFIDEEFGPWCLDFASEHKEGETVLDRLRFWWHSHVNMGVIPSGTDLATLRKFDDGTIDFMIAAILNKKGDQRYDVALYREGLKFIDVPVIIEHRWHQLSDQCETDILANVAEKTVAAAKSTPVPKTVAEVKPPSQHHKQCKCDACMKPEGKIIPFKKKPAAPDLVTQCHQDKHGNFRDSTTGEIIIGSARLEAIRAEANVTRKEIERMVEEQIESGDFNFSNL